MNLGLVCLLSVIVLANLPWFVGVCLRRYASHVASAHGSLEGQGHIIKSTVAKWQSGFSFAIGTYLVFFSLFLTYHWPWLGWPLGGISVVFIILWVFALRSVNRAVKARS
jgi:hypothetical protein